MIALPSKKHLLRVSGLSFLEVLLAVALLGLLLVGGSTLLYSFSRTYFSLETAPQFERHADGVTNFLETLASFSNDPKAPAGRYFDWATSPISKKATLRFQVDKEVPFFVSKLKPLPPVTAYLEYDSENAQFWLLWHPDPRFTDNTVSYQYSLLSPFGGDIEYAYFDAAQKSWEFERASSDNRKFAKVRPQRVTLIFDRDGQSLSRTFFLATNQRNVLAY